MPFDLETINAELAKAQKNVEGWTQRLENLKRAKRAAELHELNQIAPVKPRGRKGGRKPALTPELEARAKELIQSLPLEIVAAKIGVSKRTLERHKIRAPRPSLCTL